jgi:GDP-L-fucose synthase
LITCSRKDLDLTNQRHVQSFFKSEKISQVYLAAAKVGGIYANNSYPADFIYQNLLIQSNVIHNSFLNGVKKLLFLGSSCIYPKSAIQPMKEEALLTGKLEETNEPYAIAKIAGIKMCESYNRQFGKSHDIDYRSIMPTNLYGPGDNFNQNHSHVIPALIYRFHEAKKNNLPLVTIWGSGQPKREFLYVDDMARASIYLMNLNNESYKNNITPNCSHINVGSGEEINIKELSEIIKEIVGYKGEVIFDLNKPDGVKRKFLDTNILISLGWKSQISLLDGLNRTYMYYINYLNNNIDKR